VKGVTIENLKNFSRKSIWCYIWKIIGVISFTITLSS